MSKLPTLDFGKFTHGTQAERQQIGQELAKSFIDHGFVKLINHGLPDVAIADLLELSRRFFALRLSDRSAIACVRGPNPQRGWSCVGSEQTSKLRLENIAGHKDITKLTDAREHFDAGPLHDSQFPNLWPDEGALPGFKDLISSHYQSCQKISLEIMAAVEVGLGLEPGTLVDRCRPDASEIRLNRYPPIPREQLSDGRIKRTWPHTDFGIVTLLFQDSVGGLELEDRAKPGTFLPVTPVQPGKPTEMIVNVSDTFERWTNGVIKPGLHQVSPPPGLQNEAVLPERYSCVFFAKASRDTSAGPLPHFITEDNPAQYEEITALQFQQNKTALLY